MPDRLYVAFDDTDTIDADRGTGKVGRWFADELPDGVRFVGVVRQQLLFTPMCRYTSHNSAAVVVLETDAAFERTGGEPTAAVATARATSS